MRLGIGAAMIATGCVAVGVNVAGWHAVITTGSASTPHETTTANAVPAAQHSQQAVEPEPLDVGSEGPRTHALERRLEALHYDPGPVDGAFGKTTRYAVRAFQKVHGLRPTGTVKAETRAALRSPRQPEPVVPRGADDRAEIDLTRQLLFVYEDDELRLISHTSTGSEQPYCTNGVCGDAVTPTGDFEASWRVDGWRTSKVGRLYNPVYFAAGGIAVHGHPRVPLHPASHGCARIPIHTAQIFPKLIQRGEAVYVREPAVSQFGDGGSMTAGSWF